MTGVLCTVYGAQVYLGVFHRFSINIRIELHFFRLHWEMERHWSRVNLVKREALLKDLHATSVFHFPMQTKKVYFNT